jgi:hypothetical protein
LELALCHLVEFFHLDILKVMRIEVNVYNILRNLAGESIKYSKRANAKHARNNKQRAPTQIQSYPVDSVHQSQGHLQFQLQSDQDPDHQTILASPSNYDQSPAKTSYKIKSLISLCIN